MQSDSKEPTSYTDVFNEAFPYYLAMGMTYDEFWNKDVTLVKSYRKADRIRRERRNEELWLQGMYIYEAMLDVAPVFRLSMGTKRVEPLKYRERPYPLTAAALREEKQREQNARIEAMMKLLEVESARTRRLEKQREEGKTDG